MLGKQKGTPNLKRSHKLAKIWVIIYKVMRRWRESTITLRRKNIHTTTIKFLILIICIQDQKITPLPVNDKNMPVKEQIPVKELKSPKWPAYEIEYAFMSDNNSRKDVEEYQGHLFIGNQGSYTRNMNSSKNY